MLINYINKLFGRKAKGKIHVDCFITIFRPNFENMINKSKLLISKLLIKNCFNINNFQNIVKNIIFILLVLVEIN